VGVGDQRRPESTRALGTYPGIVLMSRESISIARDHPVSDAASWAQQLQRLNLTAANQAIGHCLRGCANLVMARTPTQALAALQNTQRDLLRLSADTIAEAAKLWRR
jgi:hypothetical protein